jgi:hypothetical protein
VKKSSSVAAPLLASAALAFLAGCRNQEMKRCVDEHNTVVDDSLCNAQQQQQRPNPAGGFYPIPFRWYYGGWGGFGRGSTVGGGGFVAAPGHSYASPTTRGGFGSSFSGSSGGSGE